MGRWKGEQRGVLAKRGAAYYGRWREFVEDPDGAISWKQVNRKLCNVSDGKAEAIRILNENVAAAGGRLMVLQGVRPDEAMRAKAEDVVGDQWTIQSGKSAAAKRVLTLTAEAAGILAARSLAAGASGWLFRGKRAGTRLTKLNGVHDKALRMLRPLHGADFGFVLYDLRHTFATRMAAAGVPITTLAKILGHSSLRIVMRYVHPTEGDVRAAMKMFEAAAVVKKPGGKEKIQ